MMQQAQIIPFPVNGRRPKPAPEPSPYVRDVRTPNTRRGYDSDLRQFRTWCAQTRLEHLPAGPATLAAYLTHLADSGRRVATIERALAAISQAHQDAGYESPRTDAGVRLLMKGVRRTLGTAVTRKAPLLVDDLQRVIATIPNDTRGLRDRALLLLGFGAALRRSEIVGLDASDVRFSTLGVELVLRRSKTDPDKCGQSVGVPYGTSQATCPVHALRRWLDVATIVDGPVFRSVDRHGHVRAGRLSSRAVSDLVKTHVARVGLDPASYSGHSLRAGFATSAIRAGKPEGAVMRQTRHRSIEVFRGYVRDADLFGQNAASGIGL